MRFGLAMLACAATLNQGVAASPSATEAFGTSDFALDRSCPRYFRFERDRCYLEAPYPMRETLAPEGRAWLTLPWNAAMAAGLDPRQIALGRLLFFDPLLSRDGSVSCAHCHDPRHGLSDGRDRSVGIGGQLLSRGAPSLWNVGFQTRLFWDGRARTLEEQAEGPLFSPEEMGHTPASLREALNQSRIYRRLFAEAFADMDPHADASIEVSHVTAALASFQRSLLSFDSPYDRYVAGDHDALDQEQLAGYNVFRSFVARCAECHVPPLFTTGQLMVIGAPDGPELPVDVGAGLKDPGLHRAFRVPSLRHVAQTAPYMHSGVFPDLAAVVRFYDEGGGRTRPHPPSGLHWHIRRIGMAPDERRALVRFLEALTSADAPASLRPAAVPSRLSPGGL